MEFESVEEALGFLLDTNHQGNEMRVATVNPDGTRSDFKKATLKDYKESNREAVYALCDMLGLEKVYLVTNGRKPPYFSEEI
ncbi:hypothetical protein [Ligilactobacillus salivarius]|uniref:Uncharacterized protein n=1 Tax=Ligilactobacillus salivarius TaxID=1624 RepID=A0A9X6S5W9_9LACO|nr:hypothetical protein [Ligilactobacillus salivarius]PAY26020.1 hypothetical protein A8C33_09245 [Ligilactobacillus salivarius]PAY27202.1 hypothetical protein A8C44_11350 [Ligilactobacillus salivarius]PAY28307.1 hypothetical protein A8C49_08775 [Ligilactobacillus salivarius]PAY36570.1 hypothetical protein A8C50_04880 [Ligilactobacillus salivarius]PAY42366.1 hypothetical protein A8C51_04245 [Ligilactobacillus salivarius]